MATVMVGKGRDVLDAVVSDTISKGLGLVPVSGQEFELDLFAFLLQGVLSLAVLVLCGHRGQVTWLHQKAMLCNNFHFHGDLNQAMWAPWAGCLVTPESDVYNNFLFCCDLNQAMLVLCGQVTWIHQKAMLYNNFLFQCDLNQAMLVLCGHHGQVAWLHQKVMLYNNFLFQ